MRPHGWLVLEGHASLKPATMMVRAPEDRTIDTLTRWATSKCGDRIESPLISSADPMPRGAIGEAAFGPHMIHRSSWAGV